MVPDFARGSPLREALYALVIVGVAWVLAWLVRAALTMVAKVLTRRTPTKLDDFLLDAIGRPLFVFIIIQGAFIALTSVSYLDRWQTQVNKAWIAVAGAVVVVVVQRLVSALLRWYGAEIASKAGGRLDDNLMPLARRFLTVVIYAVGALLILDNAGIEVSPLLAGLGLGGLAVALALQPTLSNLFASAYVVADGAVKVGDFVELQDGPRGTVLDIGWRSTKLQTPTNNLVVVPNSKLADSVVTNYMAPTPEVFVFPACGVSYESDLTRVEEVALDEANRLLAELPSDIVVKDSPPVVIFAGFGDSNINFWVILKATNRGASFTLTHELIKRLHARFATEGIEINYPVRKLIFGAQAPEPASLLVGNEQEPTS